MPRSLVLVSLTVALSLLGDQMLYVVLPVVHDTVGVPVVSVGLLLSANRWVRLLTNTLAAQVIARYGRQWPFVLALLLGGVTTIAYGVLYGVGVFLVARLLWGTAWSFIRIEGLSTALDVASEQTRGQFLGLYQSISRLGSAVAMLAGGICSDVMGFRATFVLFGALTCLGALLAYYEMARRQSTRGTARAAPAPVVPHTTAAPAPVAGPLDGSTRRRMIVASFGTFSVFLTIGGLVSATLGYMLHQRFGAALMLGPWLVGVASLSGFLLSSRGFLDLGFAPLAGRLADRWGRTGMLVCAMPVACVTIIGLALQPPLWVVLALVLLLFAAGSALQVTLDALAGDIAPPARRRAFLSLFVTWQDLGAATGPLLGFWIAPHFGLMWLYLSGAVVLLLAMLAYLATFVGITQQPAPAPAAG